MAHLQMQKRQSRAMPIEVQATRATSLELGCPLSQALCTIDEPMCMAKVKLDVSCKRLYGCTAFLLYDTGSDQPLAGPCQRSERAQPCAMTLI